MRLRDVVSFAAFAAIIVFVLAHFGTLGLRVNPPSERLLTVSRDDDDGVCGRH